MGVYEIIELASNMKRNYKNSDPFYFCSLAEIKVVKIGLKPTIYPAFTTNINGKPVISINRFFGFKSQKILCAHELGHAILHQNNYYNCFGGDDMQMEYEANLFAVALLFDQKQFSVPFAYMSNKELESILKLNIKEVY